MLAFSFGLRHTRPDLISHLPNKFGLGKVARNGPAGHLTYTAILRELIENEFTRLVAPAGSQGVSSPGC